MLVGLDLEHVAGRPGHERLRRQQLPQPRHVHLHARHRPSRAARRPTARRSAARGRRPGSRSGSRARAEPAASLLRAASGRSPSAHLQRSEDPVLHHPSLPASAHLARCNCLCSARAEPRATDRTPRSRISRRAHDRHDPQIRESRFDGSRGTCYSALRSPPRRRRRSTGAARALTPPTLRPAVPLVPTGIRRLGCCRGARASSPTEHVRLDRRDRARVESRPAGSPRRLRLRPGQGDPGAPRGAGERRSRAPRRAALGGAERPADPLRLAARSAAAPAARPQRPAAPEDQSRPGAAVRVAVRRLARRPGDESHARQLDDPDRPGRHRRRRHPRPEGQGRRTLLRRRPDERRTT